MNLSLIILDYYKCIYYQYKEDTKDAKMKIMMLEEDQSIIMMMIKNDIEK